MTAVTGHLTGTEFGPEYKNWTYPPPDTLFGAPITTFVSRVRFPCLRMLVNMMAETLSRTRGTSRKTYRSRQSIARPSSSGPIAIVRGNISEARSETQPRRGTPGSRSKGPSSATSRERESRFEKLPMLNRQLTCPKPHPQCRPPSKRPGRKTSERSSSQNRIGPTNWLCLHAVSHYQSTHPKWPLGRSHDQLWYVSSLTCVPCD